MNAKTKAFLEGITSGKFNNDRAKIYQRIKCGVQTIETLRAYLGKRHHNQLSGRISELLDMGVIREINGGRFSIYSVVTDIKEIEQRAKDRETERFMKWVKVGNERGYFENPKENLF